MRVLLRYFPISLVFFEDFVPLLAACARSPLICGSRREEEGPPPRPSAPPLLCPAGLFFYLTSFGRTFCPLLLYSDGVLEKGAHFSFLSIFPSYSLSSLSPRDSVGSQSPNFSFSFRLCIPPPYLSFLDSEAENLS